MQFTIKQYRKVIYVANGFYLTTNNNEENGGKDILKAA